MAIEESAKWRSTDDVPGWHDGGWCELRCGDGSTIKAWIGIGEAYFPDSGDEYPMIEDCTAEDGTVLDFFGFSEWRALLAEKQPAGKQDIPNAD